MTALFKAFVAVLLLAAVAPFSLAHAEVLLAADEQNFVAVYHVPLSPIGGEKVSWTISFVQNFSLTKNELVANYSVVEVSTDKVLVQNNSVKVRGGVSSFAHEFSEPGLYELSIEYAYLDEPSKNLSVDYQVQVRSKQDFEPSGPAKENGMGIQSVALIFFSGFALGMAVYHFATRRNRSRRAKLI